MKQNRILIVEDETINGKILKKYITDPKFKSEVQFFEKPKIKL